MRRLLWLIGSLCLLWCLWWYGATFAMERGVGSWLKGQQKAGRTAQATLSTGGFPMKLQAQLNDVVLEDPRNGLTLDLPVAKLSTPTYWPGYATVILSDQPVSLITPVARFTLQGKEPVANLFLHPGTALELQTLSLRAGAWALNTQDGNLVTADTLRLSLVQDAAVAARYDLDLQANALTPGDLLRSALDLPAGWPAPFEAFEAELAVTFAAPLDRSAFDGARPQPRAIDVSAVRISWGEIDIAVSGALDIDPRGVPTGEIAFRAENWNVMLDLAMRAGVLHRSRRGQVELMARALANVDGKPDDLDLTFVFKDGNMSMGPIPLGPAPRIVFR